MAPPLHGHTNRLLPVSEALRQRGATVAWAGYASTLAGRLPDDIPLFALTAEEHTFHEGVRAANQSRGFSRYQSLLEDVIPTLTGAMLAELEPVLRTFRPDVVVADQHALAAAIAAQRHALPWVTWAAPSGVADFSATYPTATAQHGAALESLAKRFDAAPPIDLSPWLTITPITRAFVPGSVREGPIAFVGPTLASTRPSVAFPWDQLAETPRVLVTFGTINVDLAGRLLREAIEAFRGWRGQAIISGPTHIVSDVPPNVILQERLPVLQLMPHVNAVMCHGGYNTVVEALSHGVPLVLAPIADDQPFNTKLAVESGAAVRLKFSRARASTILKSIEEVVTNQTYRDAAGVLRSSFEAAGGAELAASLIESIEI
ncbi:MAG: glycosyltransferase [Bacteroidota bacterium]